jgi:2-dehydro-3-deoxyphosphogluconate aldolase/(4S)-4-hydroxy-2-oxoglutarate aldolase
MPTGGVSPTRENLEGWFKAGVTCVGMGSKLISKDIVNGEKYAELQTAVSDALALIKEIR